jgi:hypothetical protein
MQFNMAVCCLEGWGIGRHKTKAAKWLREAAKGGDVQAAVLLATLQGSAEADKRRDVSNMTQDSELGFSTILSPKSPRTPRSGRGIAGHDREGLATGLRKRLPKSTKASLTTGIGDNMTAAWLNSAEESNPMRNVPSALPYAESDKAANVSAMMSPRKKARMSTSEVAQMHPTETTEGSESVSSTFVKVKVRARRDDQDKSMSPLASQAADLDERNPLEIDTVQSSFAGQSGDMIQAGDTAAAIVGNDLEGCAMEVDSARADKTNIKAFPDPSLDGILLPQTALATPDSKLPVQSEQISTAQMSVHDVCRKLREAGLDQYCKAFEESVIDGSMLNDLPELWEQPLGVSNKAHQIRILRLFGKT